MGIVFEEGSQPRAGSSDSRPSTLTQLLAATRANTADVMERLTHMAQAGEPITEELVGAEYLLFTCGGVACGIQLTALREILPVLPHVVSLPASPEWTLGVFALRTDIIALIDAAPVLLEGMEEAAPNFPLAARSVADHAPEVALIVGAGDRCLALVIQSIGDIVRLEDHEIVASAEAADATVGRVREHYSAGYYVSPRDGRRHTIIQADVFMDDVMRALQEVSNGRA